MKNRLFIITLLVQVFLGVQGICTSASAQSEVEEVMFSLDWHNMPLDSVAPRYSESIPLETDWRLYDYHVKVLYPEWKAMSKDDARKMEQWADSVSYDLAIHSYVGVMRGRGLLDVDFIPVVRRDGKYYKLTSAKMEIHAVAKDTYTGSSAKGISFDLRRQKAQSLGKASERYARHSKLSVGRWVKIGIQEDGMYRLTRESLSKMGFSNPDNVHLYGYGGHRLSEVSNPEQEYDDLQEVPLLKVAQDTWLFWGNGLLYWDGNKRIFNPYAKTACYFLTEENAPNGMDSVDATSTAGLTPVTSFTDHVLYEKDEFAYAQTGRNLFEAVSFANSNSRSYKLTTNQSLGEEKLEVSFSAADNASTVLIPSVNGSELDKMTIPSLSSYQAGATMTRTYDVSKLSAGADWNIRLTSTQGHEAHLDYLALHFKRSLSANQSFVAFGGIDNTKGVSFQIKDFTDNHAVLKLSQPGSPACLVKGKTEQGAYVFASTDPTARYVCFNKTFAYPQPTLLGEIANQDLHALDSLDMVIIIPESGMLQGQAQRLAEAHAKYDGLRCAVVRADQVYNEFSSGTPDATAYRNLMKMLYDRANGEEAAMPRYLLLMGDGTFDNRMLTPAWQRRNPKDYLLCFESENSVSDTESYVMEDYFGVLDDGEGINLLKAKPDVAVGRFPVTTADEARVMVDKVIDYISNGNAGSWKNVVSILGDDGDGNSHMKYADDVAELMIGTYPEMEIRKVMWDAFTRVSTLSTNTYPEVTSLLRKQSEEGVMLFNYVGHGAPYVLSHEAVLKTNDLTSFKGRRLPVWYTAACDTAPFDGLTENLGEEAVLTEGGGALAFVGTTRTVYAPNNWRLNRFFAQYIFAKDAEGRRYSLGDALRLAKCTLAGEEKDKQQNKLQYCLLGDPAIVLGAPLNRVKMVSMTHTQTGKAVDGLKAGMPVTIEGEVQSAEGRTLDRFCGSVSVRVYDSMDTITCLRNDPSIDEAFVFSDRNSVLYVGQDSVKNGRFKLSFVVPRDIKYSNAEGRMVFYAINDSLDVEANGYFEDFVIGGSVLATDTIGPEMQITLNGEPGGKVNMSPYLVVRFADASGVNVTGNGIGHDILLSIDNNPAWTYVLNDYYVSDFGDFAHGSLGFTIPSLPAGNHVLSLRAWDMLNNTSLAEIDFEVDSEYEPTILHVGASPNPAQTHTTFFFTYDLPGSECKYTLEVFDFAGRLLWSFDGEGSSSTGQFSIPWNLRVGGGYGRISPGIYLYRVSLTSGESKIVTKTQKLIVH